MAEGAIVNTVPQKGYLLAKVTSEKVGAREAEVIEGDVKAKAAASHWKILIDLSDVTMLASMGLGMLVTLHKLCAAEGGKLLVCSVRPEIMEVLKMTHLHKVLKIVDTAATGTKTLGG